MKIKDVITFLNQWAPPSLQESYDNSGLIVGDKNADLKGIIVSLDCMESVVDEAIEKNCNLIVAHHPIVFSGLKSITGKNYIERTLIKAIKNDINIFSIHTNLDNIQDGVNWKLGEKIGLENLHILNPKRNLLKKIVVFCPLNEAERVRDSMFKAGAGDIGDYDECSFNSEGYGTFRASDNANPHVGVIGKRHKEEEVKIECICPEWLCQPVITEMKKNHPYEEVAYDVYPLDNEIREIGSGMIGNLPQSMKTLDFLMDLKSRLNLKMLRHTEILSNEISKVAFCGGSGSFLLENAVSAGADIFITADYKYHQFFDADKRLVIVDVGHYESEYFTIELIFEKLKEKFANFALHFTLVNTNPVKYL